MADNTRYQILYSDSSKVENFTAAEHAKFRRRVEELKRTSIKFTTWDTRRNSLSSMFTTRRK